MARASGQDDKSSPLLMDENPLAIELRSRLQETQVAKKSSGEFDWLEVEGAYVRLPAGTPEGRLPHLILPSGPSHWTACCVLAMISAPSMLNAAAPRRRGAFCGRRVARDLSTGGL